MQGATVYLHCRPDEVGQLLHMLEDSEVFVVNRFPRVGGGEALELRSLEFPAEWHGGEVGAVVTDGFIERFVPVLRPGCGVSQRG